MIITWEFKNLFGNDHVDVFSRTLSDNPITGMESEAFRLGRYNFRM